MPIDAWREITANTPRDRKAGRSTWWRSICLALVGYSAKGEVKSPQAHYATLDVALIRLLKPMLATVMAKRCTTCWWVYGPELPNTLKILTETGSIYKGEVLIWRKPGILGSARLAVSVLRTCGTVPVHGRAADSRP